MPYVYKYVDKEDDIVKYVGIVKKDSNFPKRFYQHRRDSWYEDGNWKIFYIEVPTITDAEALEGHFISEYGTDEYFNKAKVTWGKLSYAPKLFDWKEWKETYPVYSEKTLTELHMEMLNLEDMAHNLLIRYQNYRRSEEQAKKASVYDWFYTNFTFSNEGKYKLTDCFEHYRENYCGGNTNLNDYGEVWFSDFGDFVETLKECKTIKDLIQGDCLCWVKERSKYEL